MGDPGLVAGHLVDIAVLDRAGLQGRQVRSRVWFREHGRRQDFAGRDLGQVMGLLFRRAAQADQLRRDFRPGAERADADIAPRQFFRDHAHGDLAHAQAAALFRHGQAEHAQFRHLIDDLDGDQVVGQMPFMGMGHDLILDELVELVAHHVQHLVVQAQGAEMPLCHDLAHAGPQGRRVAARDQGLGGGAVQGGHVVGRQAQVRRAHDFDLGQGDAALDLGQVFAERGLDHQLFHLAEGPGALQAFGPAEHLAQALDIGRQPGQAMGRHLVGVDQGAGHLAVFAAHVGDLAAGGGEHVVGRALGLAAKGQKIGQQNAAAGCAGVHDASP